MATSGTLQGSTVHIAAGHNDYMFVNWQLASQNVAGNYSTINWQAYFAFHTDDAQLDAGSVGSNVGTLWNVPGRVYNFASNFTTRNLLLASSSFNIGHNADGTQSLALNCSIAVYQTGTSSGSAGWALPTIPRYANITSFTSNSVTDTFFNLQVNTDVTCNSMTYSIDNGAHYTQLSGSFTSKTVSIQNLLSETTYPCKVQVQRADSGLWTTSGTINVTTGRQNNFIGII